MIAYSLYWDQGDATRAAADTPLIDALVTSFVVTGVTGGAPYRFAVRARNIYGPGPFSAVLTVVPADAPGKTGIPTAALTDASQTSVTITWPAPDAHSSPVTAYQILFLQANGAYAQELTHCDGTQAGIVASTTCLVPMAAVTALTSLPRESLIRVRVRAFNARGTGQFSELNTAGATVETLPTNLSVVSVALAGTSNVATQVAWTALTGAATGGSNVAVTDYELYWDQGHGSWLSLANTTGLTYSATGLSGGQTYAFEIRAYNKYGYGPFTAAASVQTSQAPSQPAQPVIEVVGSYVNISWTPPFSNYMPIAGYGYQILIAAANGSFVLDQALCDGVAQAAVGYCLVSMWDLRSPPFLLTYGTLVQAEVLAANARGWSAPSLPNTVGATIQVEPSTMLSPTRGVLTGPTQLDVHWSSLALIDAGGSAVLSYDLQYDNATAASTWLDVIGLSPNSLLTSVIVSSGVVPGAQYAFRVRARNIFGWGPFSAVTYIQAACAPAAPLSAVTSIDPATGGVVITWTAPNNDGSVISAYLIEIANVAGTAWSSVSTCNGSDPSVVAALTCIVPMSTLTADPFDYLFGNVVYVRVSATNTYGFGSVSATSSATGATIAVVPTQMQSPW